jgi:hypothetical protein
MFLKNVVFRKYFIASLILGFVSIAVFFVIKSFLPPEVPVFYGKPVGEDQLVPNIFLLVIPAVSILISMVNIIVSKRSDDDLIKKILAISSLIAAFMAIVTTVKVILLVGFF